MSEGDRDFRLMVTADPFDPLDRPAAGPGLASGSPVGVIVQFTAPLTSPDVARLKAAYAGLALTRYVPNLAYAEHLPSAVVDQLRQDFLVRACVPLDAAMKTPPWTPPPAGPVHNTAVLFDDADAGAVEPALAAIGARDIEILDDRPSGGALHVRLTLDDPATLPQVAGLADVLWVEPTPVAVNRNVEAAQTIQSGRVGPGSNPIWDKGLHGEGQIIGILDDDTIDLDHCFFADAAPNQAGPAHRKVIKIFNGTGPGPGPGPTEHFMFVAAIAAGDDRGNLGKHPHRGGAYAARLVCRNRNNRSISMYDALEEAMTLGATIHNNSWGDVDNTGATITFYNTTCEQLDRFSWKYEDNLVVAAGNDTGGLDNSPPGIAKNTLCVACAKAHPNHMTRGSGISGPTFPDGRRKPEIMAVGCDISSALVDPTNKCATGLSTKYLPCGTSWASSNAAAAAALVRQYFTEGWWPTGEPDKAAGFTPSGALIKAVLLNSTVNMTGHRKNPSDIEGWGLIQLDRTLYFHGGARRLAVRDVRRADGMESGEVRWRVLHVGSGNEQLKITLVWTDHPPSQNSFRSPSTNVIEMTITDPNGIVYRANDIDLNTGLSKPNGTGPLDKVNNVQMVIVDHPPPGGWVIRTRATVNAGGEQGFAIVASGSLLQNIFLP